MHLVIEPARVEKTRRLMEALEQGIPGSRISWGAPPRGEPFIIWGHLWTSLVAVPQAVADGTPFWVIDNGWLDPANGTPTGYYCLTRCGLSPVSLPDPDMARNPVVMDPWKERRGGYVLLALPGSGHGRMLGMNMARWSEEAPARIQQAMGGCRLVIRSKATQVPLADQLRDASILVTHSSKAAIAAIRAGIPVACEASSATAPVSVRIPDMRHPIRPERSHWWASLMCQQYTIREMARGLAWQWMKEVERVSA